MSLVAKLRLNQIKGVGHGPAILTFQAKPNGSLSAVTKAKNLIAGCELKRAF